MLEEVSQAVSGLLGFPGYLRFWFVAVKQELEASLALWHSPVL